jgi:hypothetical protein
MCHVEKGSGWDAFGEIYVSNWKCIGLIGGEQYSAAT